jgi:hypothetical protein
MTGAALKTEHSVKTLQSDWLILKLTNQIAGF